MQSKMIERDILFIMLATNKCMDAFQMLKSVHFPPYSQLPQSQYAITETSQRNTTLSRDTGSVTPQTVVSSSPIFPRTKGGLQCTCEQKPRLSLPHSANSSDAAERQHVGVRSLQSVSNLLSVFGQRCACKQKTQSNSL